MVPISKFESVGAGGSGSGIVQINITFFCVVRLLLILRTVTGITAASKYSYFDSRATTTTTTAKGFQQCV